MLPEDGSKVICQFARMGDLIQTLPLISAISRETSLKLVCDTAVEPWAKLLPSIDEIISIDTKHWRQLCTGEYLPLLEVLSEIDRELNGLQEEKFDELINLNDHPVSDAFAACLCDRWQEKWITENLILLRSYLRTIVAARPASRIHLADLWRTFAPGRTDCQPASITETKKGTHFAKATLNSLRQAGYRQIWAFILGSGEKYRRIKPEIFADYWNKVISAENVGLVLIGGAGEEILAEQFKNALKHKPDGIIDLTGKCSPEELVAVFREADLVVGVDTGPLHWAAAVGTQVLGLYFGEAGFRETGPYGDGHYVIAPDCSDYPCTSMKAAECRLCCQEYYSDSYKIATAMLEISRKTVSKRTLLPAGLKLYQSSLTPNGITYNSLDGVFDPLLAVDVSNASRIILSGWREKLDVQHSADQRLNLFMNQWADEIRNLPLGCVFSPVLIESTRNAALQRIPWQRMRKGSAALPNLILEEPPCVSCF